MFGANKEDKKEQRANELMTKYGLDHMTDEADRESVKKVINDIVGSSVMEMGALLTGSGADATQIGCLRALIEQNFIIIRQLDRLSK